MRFAPSLTLFYPQCHDSEGNYGERRDSTRMDSLLLLFRRLHTTYLFRRGYTMQTSHRIMEAHEIQDLILGFVFGDDQRKPSYTRQRCGCKMTAGITWHRAQIDDAIRKTVERVRAHKCKSLDRLRAWKNIRQCSSRLKHVADRLYTFDAFHYLDAVFRSDPSAVRFFLARHEIDANIPIALLYSCWRGDEMMAELLLSNGKVTVWRSSIIHFDPWVVSTSMRMKKILDRHVPLTKKGLCQNCYCEEGG